MPARDAFIVQLFIVPFACFGAAREKQVRRLGRSACSPAASRGHAAAERHGTPQNAPIF